MLIHVDGFTMIADMIEAKGKMAELLTRIETHHGVSHPGLDGKRERLEDLPFSASNKRCTHYYKQHFVSWYEVWGDERTREAKFRAYEEERPVSAKEVLRHLALFSRLFYDFKSLEKYGFRVSSKVSKVLYQFLPKDSANNHNRPFKMWRHFGLNLTKISIHTT